MKLGQPCARDGDLGCNAAAQRLQVLCDGGVWQAGQTCARSQNCDQTTGTCETIVEACRGHAGGDLVCDAQGTVQECGPDLVSVTEREQCPGGCVDLPEGAACVPPKCGNGKVDEGEECDGDPRDTSGACVLCQNAKCGDGYVWKDHEECDDKNAVDTDACVACNNAKCSDGQVWTGHEECDDRNTIDTDACTNSCNSAKCGDGIIRAGKEDCETGDADCHECTFDWNLHLGDQLTCIHRPESGVTCWGTPSSGQLGLGNKQPYNSPRWVGSLRFIDVPKLRFIGVGDSHVCGVLSDVTTMQALKCWGLNNKGQLGLGNVANMGDDPAEVGAGLPTKTSRYVANALCGLALGSSHTYTLEATYSAHESWGDMSQYQLTGFSGGVGTAYGDTAGETLSVEPYYPLDRSDTPDFCSVSMDAGGDNTCALVRQNGSVNGDVSCNGDGAFGQLGQGGALDTSYFTLVALGGPGTYATSVSVGGGHACAILASGVVKCWGRNTRGQLGVGDKENRGDQANEMGTALPAVDLGTGRSAKAVSAGGLHTCALLDNGSVKCWGYNYYGQLGLGAADDRGDAPSEMGNALPAVDLGTGRTARKIAAGKYHTCALLDNGDLKCWGSNDQGALGVGDTSHRGDDPGEMGNALPAVRLR